jgi:CP family cyanate transporter-like MFS transporter
LRWIPVGLESPGITPPVDCCAVATISRASGFLAIGIVLIAANLRPPVTSVSTLLSQIRPDLGLSSTAAALLSAAPVLCFGLLAPFAPRIADRLGMEPTLGLVLALVAVGLVVRIGPNALTLFGGTVLVGGAIALGNVLLPALIKRDFPGRTGALTGAYVTSLTIAASLAAGVSVPIAASFDGWRAGLGVWSILALLTLVVWIPQLRSRTPPPPEASPGSIRTLLRDPLAWQVTAFFGLQSLEFYAIVSWLPTIYRDAGFSAVEAGYLLSFATIIGAPASLIVPSLAVRSRDQRPHVAVIGLTTAAGLTGLLVAPAALPWLWAGLIGLGTGASFPLVLTLLVLRTRSSFDTARLSAMAQSIGYLIAATGPFAVGALHDVTRGWSASVALLLLLMAVLTAFGLGAARRRYVGS